MRSFRLSWRSCLAEVKRLVSLQLSILNLRIVNTYFLKSTVAYPGGHDAMLFIE